jgi:hypothetical protein
MVEGVGASVSEDKGVGTSVSEDKGVGEGERVR